MLLSGYDFIKEICGTPRAIYTYNLPIKSIRIEEFFPSKLRPHSFHRFEFSILSFYT